MYFLIIRIKHSSWKNDVMFHIINQIKFFESGMTSIILMEGHLKYQRQSL